MDFKKSDIPALDFIIDQILKTDFKVYSNDLVKAGYIEDKYPDAERKFERLLSIIKTVGCANVNPPINEDNGANAEKNDFTAKFKIDSGFTFVFDKFQREDKLIEQKHKHEKTEYVLSRWKYWTFWPLLVIAVFGTFFSISNLFKNSKSQKQIDKLEQNNKDLIIKLEALQNIVSTQIIQDSSFRENVDKKIKFLLSTRTDKDSLVNK